VTSGTGKVTSGAIGNDAHEYIVNLTGVTTGQTIQVGLHSVNDSVGNHSSLVPVSMGVLVGDTNADRAVNTGDSGQTRSRSGQLADQTNFRSDVNTDGAINSGDAIIVRSNSGKGL
jgi:hypothetical protein